MSKAHPKQTAQAAGPCSETVARAQEKPWPAAFFSVPEDIKHLDAEQLDALAAAFRSWTKRAVRPDVRLSRERVWVIFLLLRHCGAKLGEVLALDDRTDIDWRTGVVRFGGGQDGDALPREVRLPRTVAEELARCFDDPAFLSLRGSVLHMDGGYVRRKFYERGLECGLPKELCNPRILRHSRAVELLRGGVPLTVVQTILGHGSVNLTAHYLSFTREDIQSLVSYYLHKEARMKTSARNTFTGQVSQVRTGTILSEVTLVTPRGHELVSVITNESLEKLDIRKGVLVTASIKAPLVILVKDDDAPVSSMRNRLHGTVLRINEGAIAAEVVVKVDDDTEVCALVTDESVKRLGIAAGDPIWAMFKAFSVVLGVD
ncbi:molybdenum-pterin binding domain protein/site-specific recombinase, phage integrase family [hydrocarbon metagenome]|uniref:Molybdenum-pterin binding domain protein/site-specific recombinase, phage integrase family n=1 Tax=hydrocarbon metagenome TaxID=938273 RepID=A0A0W8G3B6_9ZZZZ